MNFVHLKTSSEFSIHQGIELINEMGKKARDNQMGALALTDLNGMFGVLKFYKEMKSLGIKPILGVNLTIEQEDGNKYQLTLLAKNHNGYKKLIEINSKSYIENSDNGVATAKEEWLANLEDVVVLSGAKQGLIGQLILKDDYAGAKEVAQQMKDYFGEDFYIELERDASADEDKYMNGAVNICSDLKISPVATHSNYFLEKDDFVAHEARYCISTKQSLLDIKRNRPFNKEMYFKTSEEMSELFSDLPVAIENTVAIAKKCNIELSLDNPKLPNFPVPNGEDIDSYFTQLAKNGLEERLFELFPDKKERDIKRSEYDKRLDLELKIIKGMGFPGYFLIVSDFITWAKNKDIPVGPGRGSGAGSLVAYSLKITDLDPLKYNLLFERFLNPDRVSMPDFDIDFCQARRNEVYEYVRGKYGENAVCQIGTFGTMAAKAVVRDVGRTLGYPYDFVDTLAKMILIKPNNPMTLKQFIFGDNEIDPPIDGDEKMRARYDNEPDVKKLIDIALRLEGVTRQVGTHAAGVVIAPTVLTDFTPLYRADKDSPPSTQFDMKDVESSGLVKFDFLGLRNLTIIKEAVDLVNKRKAENNEKLLDLNSIPVENIDVYKNIYGAGNTIGIFQFEGKGMTSVLQKAQPTCLEDVIAINALYRPGPMDIIPDWLKAKSMPESERPYPDPRLVDVLKETYGFMIYQEQVMQCAQIIAGYSLGGADLLRRAMGKKKPEEMAQQRSVFIEGSVKNGISEDKASYLFDLIEKFSGYGFNKSHAAAYSYLSYQTAYLKNYYPEEFFTANLNSHVDTLDTDKISVLINDLKENGLKISSPDINKSIYKFNIEDQKHIRYGLGALKGVGTKAIEAIVEEREKNGDYVDFYDFLERVGRGNVNKRVLESLVRAGAFDSLNNNRAQLFTSIEEGLDYVSKFRKKQMENVSVLGDAIPVVAIETTPVKIKRKTKKAQVELVRPVLQEIASWDEITQLKNEKASLGHFLTSNPYLTYYVKKLNGFEAATKISDLRDYYFESSNNEAFVGGLIEEIKPWKSKKGAFVTISDGASTMEVRMFSDFMDLNKDWLKTDAFVALKVKIQLQSGETGEDELTFSVQDGFSFEQAKVALAHKVYIGSKEPADKALKDFEAICNANPGSPNNGDPIATLCVSVDGEHINKKIKEIYIKPSQKLFDDFSEKFGDDLVKIVYKKTMNSIVFKENKKKGYSSGVKKSQVSI
jgi:DNA polymerase-3 subunit alpha